MHSKRLTSLFTIAACGVLLTGAGAAAASSPAARAGADLSAARAATGAPASGGHVFFTAYQNDDLPGATVVLSGAIGDFGAAVSVLRNGTIDPEHTSQLNLALTQGTFRIVIGPLHLKLENALPRTPFNLKTCSGHVTVTGTAPVVEGSGTGAYKGIRGSFTLTITANEKTGQLGQPCQRWTGLALGEAVFISGPGTVSSGG